MKRINKDYHLYVARFQVGGADAISARNEGVLRFLLLAYSVVNSEERENTKTSLLNKIVTGLNSIGCEFDLTSLVQSVKNVTA